MNEKTIKELVKIVEESNISELEVSHWGKKVRIVKNLQHSNNSIFSEGNNASSGKAIAGEVQENQTELVVSRVAKPEFVEISAPAPAEKIGKKTEEICSPMVGTFYRAPAPDAEPYVKEGDRIEPGRVLCIVEAMKLMNEIEAEISGTIVEILVDNAQPVEYNQPLFKIAVD